VRLDAACARSLSYELVDVRRPERIIVLAIEGDLAVDELLSPIGGVMDPAAVEPS
jgi:hypothetical protein